MGMKGSKETRGSKDQGEEGIDVGLAADINAFPLARNSQPLLCSSETIKLFISLTTSNAKKSLYVEVKRTIVFSQFVQVRCVVGICAEESFFFGAAL